jgi:hypothetical protein
VVAAEVKAPATLTVKATAEIDMQVADMQSATKDTVAASKEIGSTITLIFRSLIGDRRGCRATGRSGDKDCAKRAAVGAAPHAGCL